MWDYGVVESWIKWLTDISKIYVRGTTTILITTAVQDSREELTLVELRF